MSKRQNTIYLYATAITQAAGGSHTILVNLLNNLHQFHTDATQFILLAPIEYAVFAKEKNVQHIIINHNKKWLKRLYWERFLGKKLIKNNPNTFLLSLQNTLPNVGSEVQTIAYVHTSICFDKDIKIPLKHWRENLKKYFYASAIKNSFTPNTILLVQTKWMEAVASSALDIPRSRAHIATPTVPPKSILPVKTTRPKVATFFYPAKFYFHKNHKAIFEALQLLSKKRPTLKVKVVLTLDEKNLEKFKTEFPDIFTSKTIEIENLGFISNDLVDQTYDASSALLFPSILETFGLPLIEARQKGLPIICSNLSYAKEVLGNYPFVHFFDPYSPEDIADAMITKFPEIEQKQHETPDLQKSIESDRNQYRKTTLLEILKTLIEKSDA